MKVPTYTNQVQRTAKTGAQRLNVRMNIGAATKDVRAKEQLTGVIAGETAKYYEEEQQRKERMDLMRAENASNKELQEALEKAQEMSRNDPEAAQKGFEDARLKIRDKYNQGFQTTASKELFDIRFDGYSEKFGTKVRQTARSDRARLDYGTWTEKATILAENARNGSLDDEKELFDIHFPNAIKEGFMDPSAAQQKMSTLKTDFSKQRIIGQIDKMTLQDMKTTLEGLEQGKVPDLIADDWGRLTPDSVKKFKTSIQSQINSEEALNKAAEKLLSDEKKTELIKFAKNPNNSFEEKQDLFFKLLTEDIPDLNNAGELSVITALEGAISRKDAEAKATIKAIRDEVTDLTTVLKSDLFPDGTRIESLANQVVLLGDALPPDVRRKAVGVINSYTTVSQVRKMTLPQMENYIARYRAGSEGQATTADSIVVDIGEGMIAQARSDIESNNALSNAASRGLIAPITPINPFTMYSMDESGIAVGDDGLPLMDPEKVKAFTARKQQAKAAQVAMGLQQPQFFTKNEIIGFRDHLLRGDFGTRLSMLRTLTQGFGQDAELVIDEITGDDKSVGAFAVIGHLLVDGKGEAAELALRGMDYMKAGNPVTGTTAEMNTAFQDYAAESFVGMDEARSATMQVAKAIYAFQAQTAEVFDTNAFEDAVNLAVGAVGDRGGIGEVNGAKTILPSNMTQGRAELALEKITAEHLRDPEIADQEVSDAVIKDINENDYKIALIPDTGKYYIYRGNVLTSEQFSTMADVNDDPIIIDLQKWQDKYGAL